MSGLAQQVSNLIEHGARLLDAVATGDNTVRVAGSTTSVTLPAIIPVRNGDRCVVLEQPAAGGLHRIILGPTTSSQSLAVPGVTVGAGGIHLQAAGLYMLDSLLGTEHRLGIATGPSNGNHPAMTSMTMKVIDLGSFKLGLFTCSWNGTINNCDLFTNDLYFGAAAGGICAIQIDGGSQRFLNLNSGITWAGGALAGAHSGVGFFVCNI